MLSDDRMLQQFGLGLAVAILLDAVIIRSLIVPAALHMLGRRARWLPAWLERRSPKVFGSLGAAVPPDSCRTASRGFCSPRARRSSRAAARLLHRGRRAVCCSAPRCRPV
ncbi:MMPL family transporter [Streptomyces sp. FxanaA7]|uniref:MMPL family transporter n=1 Tax=Streptomyces sp. FxanaA7 TaxID=1265492 RepID=UPI003B64247F